MRMNRFYLTVVCEATVNLIRKIRRDPDTRGDPPWSAADSRLLQRLCPDSRFTGERSRPGRIAVYL